MNAIVNIKEDEALQIVKEAIEEEKDPYEILASCKEAMKIVGGRFEKHEYFLPELIASGEMLKRVSDILRPGLESAQKTGSGSRKRGKVVLGTVRGDIHDIGKDIVGLMLDANGFEVIDLGVDVPEAEFVATVTNVLIIE